MKRGDLLICVGVGKWLCEDGEKTYGPVKNEIVTYAGHEVHPKMGLLGYFLEEYPPESYLASCFVPIETTDIESELSELKFEEDVVGV